MNNVLHSRVNNRNIYQPRARVSGSWGPAILDAFLASRSRDNKKNTKSKFQSFSVTLLADQGKAKRDKRGSARRVTMALPLPSIIFLFSLIIVTINTLNAYEENITMDLASVNFFFWPCKDNDSSLASCEAKS